jgi:chorismate synthase
MGIEIRPIADHRGLRECERLQQEIWGFEELGVVPDHLLLTTITGGGCLLGAYDDMRLIGFVFSLVGLDRGRKPKHTSLMAGVLPQVRYQGVGYQLKLAQREFVLNQGIDLITWTFDPLQSANAHFNLCKLGVIAQRYERNFYGDMRDELNRGLPSDRLLVEWWLKAPRVEAKLRGRYRRVTLDELDARGAKRVNRTEKSSPIPFQGEDRGWPVNVEHEHHLGAQKLLVEIPTDISRMKAQNPELAQRWRMETREIFEHYLGREYIVSDFITAGEDRGRQGFYLLERVSMKEVLCRDED